ncbi:unnamed protein product, partial [Iphiclides podalirius]
MVALTASELPPSKSYLPPPAARSAGYPQGPQGGAPFNAGIPEVVAARSLDAHGQEAHGNSFARSIPHDHGTNTKVGRLGDHAQEYDELRRNAVEGASEEPANYNFGYMVNDYQEGTEFGHHEESLEGSAHGKYQVLLPDGRRQTVSYEADGRGFKPRVSYQDNEDLGRSGYDSNASNLRSAGGNHDNNFARSNHDNGITRGNHDNGFGRGNHRARSNGY